MGNIYVFGHRNPDTDSVTASIAMAYLKNMQGFKAVPKITSEINKETEYVLNYWGVEKPQYLNDVKIRIKDIKYEKKMFINENASITDAYNKMASKHTTAIPIVSDDNILTGYVTLKEIAKYLFSNDKQTLSTSLDNIVNSLEADVLVRKTEIVNGKVAVAGLETSTFNDELKVSDFDIIVVGNRPRIISHAIDSKVSLIILTYGSSIDKKLLKNAKDNNVTIIRSHLDSFNISNKIASSNYIKSINTNHSPVVVHDEDYYSDFKEQMHKVNHTNYPVVSKKGECLGLIRLTGPNNYKKQDVILVDHNSFSQSVEGIEEANIIEIIDHHNLGAINTTMPINFRSMPVGCTATIIYTMFIENKIKIPKNIAGLLLSAILSDTLLFTSPTTTAKDKTVATILAKMAKVNVNKYGMDMLKAGSSIEGMSIKNIVYNDFKSFNIEDKQLGISQLLTLDFENIKEKMNQIIHYLDEKIDNGYYLSVMFVTDIIKNGSYIIYNTKSEELIKESFGLKEIHQGIFVKDLISRKKQILPSILDTIE